MKEFFCDTCKIYESDISSHLSFKISQVTIVSRPYSSRWIVFPVYHHFQWKYCVPRLSMLIETQANVYICVFQVRIRSAFHVSSIYAIIPVNNNTHASPVCTLTQSWSNSLLVSCFSVSSNETTFCLLELSHSSLAEVLLKVWHFSPGLHNRFAFCTRIV